MSLLLLAARTQIGAAAPIWHRRCKSSRMGSHSPERSRQACLPVERRANIRGKAPKFPYFISAPIAEQSSFWVRIRRRSGARACTRERGERIAAAGGILDLQKRWIYAILYLKNGRCKTPFPTGTSRFFQVPIDKITELCHTDSTRRDHA